MLFVPFYDTICILAWKNDIFLRLSKGQFFMCHELIRRSANLNVLCMVNKAGGVDYFLSNKSYFSRFMVYSVTLNLNSDRREQGDMIRMDIRIEDGSWPT
ncbi:hypothetical protein GWI33_019724 [Rhynchophorus ferrugineus]|uniref:Uncharacterized protein n=1 Tax=Rhynchophorus ferrugineus TaxID=354439 RepID=A0A834HT60_RHYFE|nr:hypothetical protein GWI33_019724 [Rhynchophorus ferrugineus]